MKQNNSLADSTSAAPGPYPDPHPTPLLRLVTKQNDQGNESDREIKRNNAFRAVLLCELV